MATNFNAHETANFRFLNRKENTIKLIPCEILYVRRNGNFKAKFKTHEAEYGIVDYSRFENAVGNVFAVVDKVKVFKEYHSNSDEKHLIDWIREILIDSAKPMHYSEIRRELLNRGYVCPIVESEDRTPIECRIKTRIIDNEKIYGNHDIIKVGKATYQYVG